jgi:glycosyltransferase involved in cell wall biosynthesis
MSALPSVAVYTITYKQPERLRLTLDDLLRQDYPPDLVEVVVLDDGSADETANVLDSFARDAPFPVTALVEEHERDYQSSKRWNQCIAATSPRSTVLVQIDDVRLRPDFLSRHAAWHAGDRLRLVSGAKFETTAREPSFELSTCRRGVLSADGSATLCPFVSIWGASLSFRRELLELVLRPPFENPYDDRMAGWGWHEVELAYRMERAGAQLVYDPGAGVYHQVHDDSIEIERRGLRRAEEVTRSSVANQVYLREKHHLASLPWPEGPGPPAHP